MHSESSPQKTLRPRWMVFVLLPTLYRFLGLSVLAAAAYFFLPLFAPWTPTPLILLAIVASLTLLSLLARQVAYQKTSYAFFADRLVARTGSLLSSSKVDLPFARVTQVVLRQPFWERRLFHTGQVRIHTAGSHQGTAHLLGITDSDALYDELGQRLRDNGFSLQRTRELQKERPHLVGTFLDTSGLAVGSLVALLTFVLSIGGTAIDILGLANFYELFDYMLATSAESLGGEELGAYRAILGLILLVTLGSLYGLLRIVLHFIDLNRRTYTLWDDVVDYSDGFLTRSKIFLPIEGLADTSIHEPFFKRLFGIADVELNPQGASGGVAFPSMPHADAFRDRLHRLIEESEPLRTASDSPRPSPSSSSDDDVDTAADTASPYPVAPGLRLGPPGAAREFRPSVLRGLLRSTGLALPNTLAVFLIGAAAYFGVLNIDQLAIEFSQFMQPALLFGTFPAVAFLLFFTYHAARQTFLAFTTRYSLGRKKISTIREFVSRDETEFTLEKITTFTVQRNLVDRLLGTETLRFYSIGNAFPLVFRDLPTKTGVSSDFLDRLGMRSDPDTQRFQPAVSPVAFLMVHLKTVAALLLITALLVALRTFDERLLYGLAIWLILPLAYLKDLFRYQFGRLELFADHLELHLGLLRRQRYYLSYAQIRALHHVRFPLSRRGRLTIIPGNDIHLAITYLKDLPALHQRLDQLLYQHPLFDRPQPEELDTTLVLNAKPQARNLLLKLLLLVFLAPLWPILLPYAYVRVRRTTFRLEEGRLRIQKALLFRQEHSLLLNRVDQLITNRGALESLLKNGRVEVLTIGTQTPEMVLGPLPNEEELFDAIKPRLDKN